MTHDLGRTDQFVPVLLYHSVTAAAFTDDPFSVPVDDFHRDMEEVVRTGRTPMLASKYAAWCLDERRAPTRPVLVTFDDGFVNYADRALPVLRELDLPSTIFITTGWIGRERMLSEDRIRQLASLRDTGGAPLVEIGAHSVTHPHLDLLSHRAAKRRMLDSRRRLEDATGGEVASMAYPHGSNSSRTRRIARESGYRSAYAVKNAISHPRDDPFAIARFTVHAGVTRGQVRAVLEGEGAPRSWSGDRLRTRAFRAVRRLRGAPPVEPIPDPTS